MPFFVGKIPETSIIPFLDFTVQNLGTNPWGQLPAESFPYGIVSLLLMAFPRWLGFLLVGASALGTSALGLCLYKLPLLGLDLFLFLVLTRLCEYRSRMLLIFYWLNPVLIYISYIHGQIDVASIAFLALSLVMLGKDRPVGTAVALAAATLCKFQVALALPIYMAFIWRQKYPGAALASLAKLLPILGALSFLGFLPIIMANKLDYVTIASPQAASIFGAWIHYGHETVLYLGVSVVAMILGRQIIVSPVKPLGLAYGFAVVFGAIILVTDPGPGWYFWFYPFLAILMVHQFNVPRSLYWLSVALYFLHFAGVDLLGLASRFPASHESLTFTLIQTCHMGLMIVIIKIVWAEHMPILSRTRPVLIGIAGDSGTGKNTLSEGLIKVFGDSGMSLIEGDDYHKWERHHEKWGDYTHLDPKANNLADWASHVDNLILGRSVYQPHYDHSQGTFTSPRELRPNRTLVVQGLHTFFLKSMRRHFAIKVFLAPDPMIRLAWKIHRDVHLRGHSLDKVMSTIKAREADSRLHIDPQRKLADWIIEYFSTETITQENLIEGKEFKLGVRHIFWNDTPVMPLLAELRDRYQVHVDIKNIEGDFDRVSVTIIGDAITPQQIATLAESTFPNPRRITRSHKPPIWEGGLAGINQLFALALTEQRLDRKAASGVERNA